MFREDWVGAHWDPARFHFSYLGLDFVRPLPDPLMYVAVLLLGAAGVGVALGFCYRASAVILLAVFSYIFLVEEARYLNHFYLVGLLSTLLCVIPAHRGWSVDALVMGPSLREARIPRWCVAALQAQVSVAMVFGGLAKLNGDWLFRFQPLRMWLSEPPYLPLLGASQAEVPWVAVFSWGALLIDLLFPLYLGWRRTRLPGMAALLAFNLLNGYWFYIGIFPWLMVGASLLWLGADWPERAFLSLKERRLPALAMPVVGLVAGLLSCWSLGGFVPVPFVISMLFGAAFVSSKGASTPPPVGLPRSSLSVWVSAFLAVWFLVQVALPLRHWAIPGNVAWTDEGHNFSWRMKLRDKDAFINVLVDRGGGGFENFEPLRAPWAVRLDPRQLGKMSTRPHMMASYAHRLREEMAFKGVRFHVRASLNGGPWDVLVDPAADLSRVDYPWWGHAEWILPEPGDGR